MVTSTTSTPQEIASERTLRRISVSLSLMVVGLGIALCFVARTLCVTVFVAAFLAVLVDPLVVRLEKVYIRRSLAAALVVICGMILVAITGYGAYEKANKFANQIPVYAVRLRQAIAPLMTKVDRLQQNAEAIAPARGDGIPEIKVHEAPNWPSFLVRGMGSITSGLIVPVVIPFLCFFMLIKKEELSSRFKIMFENRIDAPRFVRDVEGVIRGFVVGNLVVGLIMAGATAIVFFLLGIKNPIMLSIVLTVLNLIPFLGPIAAMAVATAAGLIQFTTPWPFIVLLATILLLHVISQNILIPRIIGSRVNVGPVAVIVGMLFWGWLWGMPGLLLAVPLTAFVELIAATQPSLVHLSSLLAATPCGRTHAFSSQNSSVYRLKGSSRPEGRIGDEPVIGS